MRTGQVRNERGASIAIVAVSLFAMLGMAALAVDMGMLLKVRSDAQRTADAAALAGASEFLNGDPFVMREEAADSALVYSARNYVGWQYVDTTAPLISDSGTRRVINSPEAYIQSIPDSQKVRVWIRRAATATWFGNLLGLDWVPIAARAAAQAIDAGSGKCVKPFAIPDLWGDRDNDTDPRNPLNKLPDIAGQQQGGANNQGEEWEFDPSQGDTYRRFKDPNSVDPSTWTGYGSSYRNDPNNWYADDGTLKRLYWDDYGRPMTIKMSNPQDSPSPGFFYPWSMPYDSSNPGAYCDANGVCQDPGNGASFYKWSISHCNPAAVIIDAEMTLDNTYLDKPGNMIGPTNQGIKTLMDQDPDACFDEFPDPTHTLYMTGQVKKKDAGGNCTLDYPNWESSPRVMLVPLFDPNQIQSGRTKIAFNNLALIFLEGQENAHAAVYGRFLYFAKSTGPTGPRTGSLVKKLQLVE
jgi:hypothetical protein